MSSHRYEENPFIKEMIIPIKKKQIRISKLGGKDDVLFNQNTGEIQGTHITTFKKVDSQKFVKLFTENIGLTFDLNRAGIKSFSLLMWAVQNQGIIKDIILIDKHQLKDFVSKTNLKLSVSTLYLGIKELEKAKIIAKTIRIGSYYINPNFCFNGDRIAFTTMIERKK